MERICEAIRDRRCGEGVCGGRRGCGGDGRGGGGVNQAILWDEVKLRNGLFLTSFFLGGLTSKV